MRKDSSISSFNDPVFYQKLTRYHDGSYLRWNRLTEKQQRTLREYELFPDKVSFVLKVFHLLKTQYGTESIPFSINIMAMIYDNYREWISGTPFKPKYLPENKAYNELIFRGFIPLSKIKIKPKRSYVMTCRPVNGKFLIHPFEMGSNYRMTNGKRELPYLWDYFHLFGLPGYTRVIYPEMEHYPNLSQKQLNHLKID